MSDPHWLPFAKSLPAGGFAKIECCAGDKSLRVSNEVKGYRAYCFRCGPQGFVAHGDFSIEQLKRRRAERDFIDSREIVLPKDFTTDIPPSEAIWLYRAGVGHALAKHYGFGYSASLRRVILPVYKEGKLHGYTARSTVGEKPKYIERLVCPASTVFQADPATRLDWPSDGPPDPMPDCVLVEDILSAVRVGRWVRSAEALMGTSLPSLNYGSPGQRLSIVVWLDPDKAGRRGGRTLQRSLTLQGHKVRLLLTDKDPKYYSNREIRRLLSST